MKYLTRAKAAICPMDAGGDGPLISPSASPSVLALASSPREEATAASGVPGRLLPCRSREPRKNSTKSKTVTNSRTYIHGQRSQDDMWAYINVYRLPVGINTSNRNVLSTCCSIARSRALCSFSSTLMFTNISKIELKMTRCTPLC